MTDNHPDLTGLRTLSGISRTHIQWLWPNYLPQGKVAVLDGDPGVGKSMISCDIAARISTARPFPGKSGGLTEPGDVLFFAPEDDMADTVIPRLTAAGANLDKIHDYTTCGSGDKRCGGRDIEELAAAPTCSAGIDEIGVRDFYGGR